MVPFNEKLWQVPLDELTSDWVSWLVPKPDVKDVVNGALGIKDKAFGYNPSFLYPASGGIKVLPEAFLPSIENLSYDSELVEIETRQTSRGLPQCLQGERTEEYERIVSTMPLPELVRRCVDLPASMRELACGAAMGIRFEREPGRRARTHFRQTLDLFPRTPVSVLSCRISHEFFSCHGPGRLQFPLCRNLASPDSAGVRMPR